MNVSKCEHAAWFPSCQDCRQPGVPFAGQGALRAAGAWSRVGAGGPGLCPGSSRPDSALLPSQTRGCSLTVGA